MGKSTAFDKCTDWKFSQCQVISDHTGSVNCIAALPEVLATGSSDGSVRIYSFDSSSTQYILKQTLRISPLFPLTLSIHATNYGILLAIGGSSPHVHLYTSQHQDLDFTRVAVLKGHEDWIRGLSFTTSNTDISLASASQDRYIRLWRISESTSFQSQDDTDALYWPLNTPLTKID
jgi:elongator complex protein 2